MLNESQQLQNTSIQAQEFHRSQSDSQPAPVHDPDEINLLEYIYVLVKSKWWIIGALVLGLALGYFLAVKKGPTYVAEAVIAAKENESQKTPNLSGLGAFGGLVASQLNIGGNPGLDKIDLILGSRKFSAELIEKYDILTMVMKNLSPKVYKKMYDTTQNKWSEEFIKPNTLLLGASVNATFLRKEIGKNNTLTLKVESKDSTFSDTLLSMYLQHLNTFIQTSVHKEAKDNVSFLENRLISIADPLLREKLQNMIASELEKEMVISKEAFKIIDPPVRTVQFKEKRLYPIVFGVGFSFVVFITVIFLHALSSTQKTKEDKFLLEQIKKKLIF